MGGKAGVAKGGVAKPAKKRSIQESAAVIDDLFAAIPKRSAREPEPEPEPAPASKPRGRAAAASGQEAADGERRPEARRRRQEEYYLDNGEKIVPVRCAAVRGAVQHAAQCLTLALCSAPRRFQDGLPVFKSFDGFSDFAGVRSPRAVAPARLRAPRLTRVLLRRKRARRRRRASLASARSTAGAAFSRLSAPHSPPLDAAAARAAQQATAQHQRRQRPPPEAAAAAAAGTHSAAAQAALARAGPLSRTNGERQRAAAKTRRTALRAPSVTASDTARLDPTSHACIQLAWLAAWPSARCCCSSCCVGGDCAASPHADATRCHTAAASRSSAASTTTVVCSNSRTDWSGGSNAVTMRANTSSGMRSAAPRPSLRLRARSAGARTYSCT